MTDDERMNIPSVVSGPELNLRYVLLSNIKIEIAYFTGRGDCTSLKADIIRISNIINVKPTHSKPTITQTWTLDCELV